MDARTHTQTLRFLNLHTQQSVHAKPSANARKKQPLGNLKPQCLARVLIKLKVDLKTNWESTVVAWSCLENNGYYLSSLWCLSCQHCQEEAVNNCSYSQLQSFCEFYWVEELCELLKVERL